MANNLQIGILKVSPFSTNSNSVLKIFLSFSA